MKCLVSAFVASPVSSDCFLVPLGTELDHASFSGALEKQEGVVGGLLCDVP